MRPALTILASALVAAGTAVAILLTHPATPGPGTSGPSAQSDPRREDLEREVRALRTGVETLDAEVGSLRTRVKTLDAQVDRLRKLDAGPGPAAAVEDATAAPAPGTPGVEPTAASSPEEGTLDREALEAVARQMTEKARRDALAGIRAVIDAGPEQERRQRERIINGVRDLARRLELPDETARQAALALLEADRRGRERIRNELAGRDLEALKREDVRPLIQSMFDDRLEALRPVLSAEQMEVVRKEDEGNRARYDDWLRLAFPGR